MIVKYFFCLAAMSFRSIGTKPHLEPAYVADVATLKKQSPRYFSTAEALAAAALHPWPRSTSTRLRAAPDALLRILSLIRPYFEYAHVLRMAVQTKK